MTLMCSSCAWCAESGKHEKIQAYYYNLCLLKFSSVLIPFYRLLDQDIMIFDIFSDLSFKVESNSVFV